MTATIEGAPVLDEGGPPARRAKAVKCSLCPETFPSPGAVRGHLLRDHPGQQGQSGSARARRAKIERHEANLQSMLPEAPAEEAAPEPIEEARIEPAPAEEAKPRKVRRAAREAPADPEAALDVGGAALVALVEQIVASREKAREELKEALDRARTAEAERDEDRKIIDNMLNSLAKVSEAK